ncbi:fibronectin type III domain-containing protein [Ruminococcus sp. AM42-11]|uniref:fibronectin type III domain-containing protein n=1 Tax=Ruminococcus sp. AM42-11 TaxID=2292372 RepID=UPI0019240832|nr:fibronectin type III domain-containing protein [Ruminococcus sp. AM42-11]
MKKKHFLTRLILCLLMALLFTPAASITAQAASKKTPTKVTISSVKAMGYNRVTVKWKKAKNATSYVIYYKQSSAKKWLKLKTVSSKTTSYVHKASKKYPLKQGVKYSYRVRAYNKTIKKYGAYSKAKTVKIPKKAAAKPTETPKPTVKPTEAPEPTAAPKPTVTPKPTATPIPKPTEAPKPTAAPQPTKAPQPTATPRPTATPAPTATPKPVKVQVLH